MSIILFRFLILCFDILIGFLCKWWSFADAKAYFIGWFRLYRSIFLMAVYLDLVVLAIIYFRYPELWQRLVEWLNLYPIGAFGVDFLAPSSAIWERFSLVGDSKRLLNNISKGGMFSRNGERSLLWLLYMAVSVITCRWNKNQARNIRNFARLCQSLHEHGGNKYLVIYLKACNVLLMQAIAGHRHASSQELGAAVGRTKGGLPRVIPASARRLIRQGVRSEIRIWTTLFSLYRVVEFRGSLSLKTITDPPILSYSAVLTKFPQFLGSVFWPLLLKRFEGRVPVTKKEAKKAPQSVLRALCESAIVGGATSGLMTLLKATPYRIARSSPNTWDDANERGLGLEVPQSEGLSLTSTSYLAIERAAKVWTQGVSYFRAFAMWAVVTGFADSTSGVIDSLKLNINAQVGGANRWLHRVTGPEPTYMGKLGFKIEPAGKVRVFAMVDCWTQWLLRPLHRAIFRLLSGISQDGTFDQLRPILRLRGKFMSFWSYDLSAATDRLPVDLQKMVLIPVFGEHLAEAWRSLLVDRFYKVGKPPEGINVPRGLPRGVQYAVGQPMGALSSWAMLALTHHAIVQYAAWLLATPGRIPKWFSRYAVLGDDIVLADAAVAAKYLEIIGELGVKVGLAKSIISPCRPVLEFAKRFFAPNDCSGVPIRELLAARGSLSVFIELVAKYKLTINQVLRVAGYGYRTLGGLNRPFTRTPTRLRNLLLALSHPRSPFSTPSLVDWYRLKGWRQLQKINVERTLQAVIDSERSRILDRLAAIAPKEVMALQVIPPASWERTTYGFLSVIWSDTGLSSRLLAMNTSHYQQTFYVEWVRDYTHTPVGEWDFTVRESVPDPGVHARLLFASELKWIWGSVYALLMLRDPSLKSVDLKTLKSLEDAEDFISLLERPFALDYRRELSSAPPRFTLLRTRSRIVKK